MYLLRYILSFAKWYSPTNQDWLWGIKATRLSVLGACLGSLFIVNTRRQLCVEVSTVYCKHYSYLEMVDFFT